mgnify:CR=1 FL=1
MNHMKVRGLFSIFHYAQPTLHISFAATAHSNKAEGAKIVRVLLAHLIKPWERQCLDWPS